eukprot:jgi/Botrbrau1/7446/Bobra.0083s0018.2
MKIQRSSVTFPMMLFRNFNTFLNYKGLTKRAWLLLLMPKYAIAEKEASAPKPVEEHQRDRGGGVRGGATAPNVLEQEGQCSSQAGTCCPHGPSPPVAQSLPPSHAAMLQAQVVQLARAMTARALLLFLPQLQAAGVAVVDEAGLLSAAGPGMLGMLQMPGGACAFPSPSAPVGTELDQVLEGAHKTAQLADFYIAGYRLGFAAATQRVSGGRVVAQPCPNDGLLQLCNTLMLTRGVASQIQAAARAQQPDQAANEQLQTVVLKHGAPDVSLGPAPDSVGPPACPPLQAPACGQ